MCNVAGIFLREYANNVECMYTSLHGHIFMCSDFIQNIY